MVKFGESRTKKVVLINRGTTASQSSHIADGNNQKG